MKRIHDVLPPNWQNTKEGIVKSMKNAPYALRHFLGWSDNEQWKHQVYILAIVELR